MIARTLNLGIVAHVDAGKTSLTERLLADAGAIERAGSVDTGDTQTDTSSIERRRGITISSAVVAFTASDTHINILDTPGHAEFVAEVERALLVLDAAVLVVSASHGVQPRTRILMRALRRMQLPTLVFVNKIDLASVDPEAVTAEVRARLSDRTIVLTEVAADGTVRRRAAGEAAYDSELADTLSLGDDRLLADLVAGDGDPQRLRAALLRQVRAGVVHPVLHGSAVTGAGTGALVAAICELLPAACAGVPDAATAPVADVFKVGRDERGARTSYVRLRSGRLCNRDRVTVDRRRVKVTGVQAFSGAVRPESRTALAGEIAVVQTDPPLRVGDVIGGGAAGAGGPQLERPALETVVRPADPDRRVDLHAALLALADEDPLIRLRTDGADIAVSLFGDIQRQVLAERLGQEYGVAAEFAPPTVLYVEKPAGAGTGYEEMGGDHRLAATVGLSVAPAPAGAGIRYHRPTAFNGVVPRAFAQAITDTVPAVLAQGPHNWPITDCTVTMTAAGYDSVSSTAGDFRLLVPLVLAAALHESGTTAYEPLLRYELDLPAGDCSRAMSALMQRGATVEAPRIDAGACVLTGLVAAARLYALQRDVASFTSGEGVLVTRGGGLRRFRGRLPERARTGPDPFNRRVYLRDIARGARA
ncbi:MAG: GTP-binding protein [Mycobacteriales bacterium]